MADINKKSEKDEKNWKAFWTFRKKIKNDLKQRGRDRVKQHKFTLYQFLTLLIAVAIGLGAGFLSYSQVLLKPDEALSNYVYFFNPLTKADARITLLVIDDATLKKYGDYDSWSRDVLAEIVNQLTVDQASVVALDVDLSKEKDEAGDLALVEACKKNGNVVAIANANFENAEFMRFQEAVKESGLSEEEFQTQHMVEAFAAGSPILDAKFASVNYPYPALSEVVFSGLANVFQASRDGNVRTTMLSLEKDGDTFDSFAYLVYQKYRDMHPELNLEYDKTSLNDDGSMGFNRIYNIDSYDMISVADYLDGNYDTSEVLDNIVLLGFYYKADTDLNYLQFMRSGLSQQDILVQSSILQALLSDKVVEDMNRTVMAVAFGIFFAVIYIILARKNNIFTVVIYLGSMFVFITACYIANLNGRRVLLLVPAIFSISSFVVSLIQKQLRANFERIQMERTMKLYMDSHVVDQITEMNPFELATMSIRRNIAVLFVDIRGFTTISESLEPEEVAKLLNSYFTVVYSAVMAWNGTLDKFIGDAAMVIFNAPNDLEDFELNAVCAADDIVKGFVSIKEQFEAEHHIPIDVGIGINCGDAIVGNIGCHRRFDYTAIGDVVNTASRLESTAKPGQILISEAMREAVKDKVQMTSIGGLSLKGKENLVEAYQVDFVDKPVAPNDLARKGFMHEFNILYTKFIANR